MAGMWELPEIPSPQNHAQPAFRLRHSITVTDYTVHVWREAAPQVVSGRWIALSRLPKLAMTGLTRKILRKAEVLAMR
jgi:hypothetical protein